MLAHTPRPARYGAGIVAQALADTTIDITDSLDGCRLAMLEAFGVEPDVDWGLVRTMALILRRTQTGGIFS